MSHYVAGGVAALSLIAVSSPVALAQGVVSRSSSEFTASLDGRVVFTEVVEGFEGGPFGRFNEFTTPSGTTFAEVSNIRIGMPDTQQLEVIGGGDVFLRVRDDNFGSETGTELVITFDRPVTAFRCNINEWQNNDVFNSDLLFLTEDGAGNVIEQGSAAIGPDGPFHFFGFSSSGEPFRAVRLIGNQLSDSWTIDDVAYGVAVDEIVGKVINPSFPSLITTQGSSSDSEIGVWDAADGSLIAQNDDEFNSFDIATTLQSSLVLQSLTPGSYVVGLGEFNATYSDDFQATPGVAFGQVSGRLAGRPIRAFDADGVVRLYGVVAADDVDPILPTGPVPGMDLGVVAQPGESFDYVTDPNSNRQLFAVYDAETGVVVVPNTRMEEVDTETLNLPAGEYILGVTTHDIQSDSVITTGFYNGFNVVGPRISRFHGFQLGDGPAVPASVYDLGEVRWFGFAVGDRPGPCPADQNFDGNLTGADFNAFLTNFVAGCP